MIRLRRLIPSTVCVLSLTAAIAGPGAAQPSSPERGPATIARQADGAPSFRQQGGDLLLQLDHGELVRIALPHQMIVHTAARHGDAVWIGGRANSREIDGMFVVAVDQEGAMTPMPSPAGREKTRTFPTLLSDFDRVAGIVWQEGDRQEDNSIRAAAWNGDDWDPVEIVSPPRGKEQTGLAATVLADGSWLAVWAAVDEDDDLWWSRRTGGVWNEPRRLHEDNDVPDILPRLAPTRDEALVAWTAYDGNDYRLRLAVLDGDSWTERPIASGRGVDPAGFVQLESGPAILFSSVVPEVWNLVGVDDAGRPQGRHQAPVEALGQPLVLEQGGKRWLHWPADKPEALPVEAALSPVTETQG